MAREMKDSGVAWIGEIPTEWAISTLGKFISIDSGISVGKKYEHGTPLVEVPYLRVANVQGDHLDLSDVATIQVTPEEAEKYKLKAGQLLMTEGGDRDKLGRGCLWNGEIENCIHQNHVFSVQTDDRLSVRYLDYLTSSEVARVYFDVTAKKTTNLACTSKSTIQKFVIPVPSVGEQRAILKYLDRKCTEIDAVLSNIRKSIDEYQKLKQAVITQAVTKGIRGNRSMKDSEVEWIGEIPCDWDVATKLSHLCNGSISYGIVKLFEPDDENGVKVLRCSDVLPGKISLDHVRTVKKEISDLYARTILRGGEVVINVRGTLGGCAVVPKSLCGYNVAREVAVIPVDGSIDNQFLMYYLLSNSFLNFESRHVLGSVYIGLNIELLSSCPIPRPPISEQKEIVTYLNLQCGEIDKMISHKEKLLAELDTYKKSLIYEYVTGKKEVPQA